METGKSLLCDYVNATIGFGELGGLTDKSPKSLMRMLSPNGNPQARNLFEIIGSRGRTPQSPGDQVTGHGEVAGWLNALRCHGSMGKKPFESLLQFRRVEQSCAKRVRENFCFLPPKRSPRAKPRQHR